MYDFLDLLQRQAEWQRSLRHLPWPEKIRMAARLREAVMGLCRLKRTTPDGASGIRARIKGDPNTGKTRPV